MTYRNWDKAQSRINYLRRWQTAVGALARAQYENGVKDECLELAMATLRRLEVSTTWKYVAMRTLAEIEVRLEELEPEEKTE